MNEHDMYLMYLPSFSNWRIHRKKDHIEVSKSYKLNIKAARTQLLGQYYNHYNIDVTNHIYHEFCTQGCFYEGYYKHTLLYGISNKWMFALLSVRLLDSCDIYQS